jgi:HK97 family phage portal protein
VLKTQSVLTEEEAGRLKDQWTRARNGTRNTAVLDAGVEYEPVELSPADIGWLETRASTAQEVARIFHIPSDMLEVAVTGGASSITYRNLAAIGADFVEWCLNAYIEIIEQAWASLPGQPPLQWDKRPLFREDLETRSRTLQNLTAAGVDLTQALRETSFGFVDAEVPL